MHIGDRDVGLRRFVEEIESTASVKKGLSGISSIERALLAHRNGKGHRIRTNPGQKVVPIYAGTSAPGLFR